MVLNYKRTAFRVIIGVIIACLVGAACFLINSKETKTDAALAGFYRVSNILYQAPMYSFGYSGPENAPLYEITKNGELLEKGGVSGGADWLNLGKLSETSLSASDFSALFSDHEGENAISGFDPADTARQLRRVWRSDATLGSSTENPVNVVCFIFALKNEDMLLSYGYPGEPGHVRWLFKLEKTAATVPLSAFPVAGETYVSSSCLYMNPLSSYAPVSGDSGCRYVIGDGSFSIINRSSGDAQTITPLSWGWQEMVKGHQKSRGGLELMSHNNLHSFYMAGRSRDR